MPRGGYRPGAGRKPKNPRPPGANSTVVAWPVSTASNLLVSPVGPPAPVAPPEPVEVPEDLTPEERKVWDEQAPHAIRQRTLTPATRKSFRMYCRLCVLEANEAKSSGVGGPNHRGLVNLVNTLETQFLLTAHGRKTAQAAEAPPVAPANPVGALAKYRT